MNKRIRYKTTGRPRKGVYLKCETCGKEFYVNTSRLKQVEKFGHRVRFCSMKCYDKTGENNPFWGRKHTKESIEKALSHPNHHRFGKGEENPNFMRWAEDRYIGTSYVWWKRHLVKNIGKCEICGWSEHKEVLEIHHEDLNHKNNDRKNIILVCPNCHNWIHRQSGTGKYAQKNKKSL